MATVRVYLPTYRRPAMLARALASLRAQTFSDWVCEVHNDQPGDPEPARQVHALGDPRFTVVEHATNLGGTRSFNLFFQPPAEPFYSLHEDDNLWAPGFLATMLGVAAAHPGVTIIWANMRVAEELSDGSLRDTGRTLWPADDGVRFFPWGQPEQVCGALHSNGAALFRTRPADDFRIPEVPFGVIEPFRERMFPHPLLLVSQPLATFTLTRETARSRDAAEWAEMGAILAATFFARHRWTEAEVAAHWARARAQHPPATTALVHALIADPAMRVQFRYSRARDWWIVLRGFVRRPGLFFRLCRSRTRHEAWWRFLAAHCAARWEESAPRQENEAVHRPGLPR